MNRRDFLKSMLALATITTLPAVAPPDLFEEIEQFLADGGEPAEAVIPRGQWGSLRLGDQWYALEGGSITGQREETQLRGDDVIVDRYVRYHSFVIESIVRGFADGSGMGLTSEFELVVPKYSFTGVASYVWTTMASRESYMSMTVLSPMQVIMQPT